MAEYDNKYLNLFFLISLNIRLKKKRYEQQVKKCNEEDEHMLKTLKVRKKETVEQTNVVTNTASTKAKT